MIELTSKTIVTLGAVWSIDQCAHLLSGAIFAMAFLTSLKENFGPRKTWPREIGSKDEV